MQGMLATRRLLTALSTVNIAPDSSCRLLSSRIVLQVLPDLPSTQGGMDHKTDASKMVPHLS